MRKVPLVESEFYHIYNRSINRESIFTENRNCWRALTALDFYRFGPPLRLSYFLAWSEKKREELMNSLEKKGNKSVEILCFCLMPNHFHLLLQQTSKDGISKFLSLFQNSYTRFFNTKNQRQGHIFQGQFKAVRIEAEEQLLHLSRYIHLNPYSSFVIRDFRELESYQWSSLPEYLGKKEGFCSKETILSSFVKNFNYQKFVFDRADYQKSLEVVKHLALEKL